MGKKAEPDPRPRARAAVTLVDAMQSETLAMQAFMGIFHPGHPKTEEIILAQRRERGRRRR